MASELVDKLSSTTIRYESQSTLHGSMAHYLGSGNSASEADWKANLKAPVKDARPQTEVGPHSRVITVLINSTVHRMLPPQKDSSSRTS